MCVCKHAQMVKTLSVTREAYDLLKRQRGPGESFSDAIVRLATSRGDLLDFAGAWKEVSREEGEEMKALVREMRSRAGRKWSGRR